MEHARKPLSPEKFAQMVEDTRWVQIMPAHGWMAEWKQEDQPGGKWRERILCLALTKEGDVEFLTTDNDGYVDKINGCDGLSRIYFNLAEYNAPDIEPTA